MERMQVFHRKGGKSGYSLSELYTNLTDLGEILEKVQTAKSYKEYELDEINRRHKDLLTKFESAADEVSMQEKGMVLVSERTIPEFFYNITMRYRSFWKVYEIISTLFGVGIIAFTLIILTYFSAYGHFPLMQHNGGGSPLIKAVGFMIGLVVGLCVHEFAHGIVLANNGIKIKQAGLMAGSMVGGFIEADEDTFFQADRKVHLRFNASSIGTNALLGVLLGFIAVLISSELLLFLSLGNLFFGIINSFPILPLDGGWVYEDLINIYLKNKIIKKILLSVRFAFGILWLILFTCSALGYNF
jgi:Zn-dependent protease